MNNDDRSSEIARRIIFAAFRIAIPSAAERISGIQDIVEAISGAKTDRWSRRDIARQLEGATDRLAARLAGFEEDEFRSLDEGDKAAAILAICAAVDSLDITKQTVIDENANADAVFARLESVASREWARAYISEDGIEYGRIFLIEASRFIVNIVRDMPDFTADVAIVTLAIARRTLKVLEQNIEHVVLPRFRSGTAVEASTFEADYRSDLIQKNKDVELFGVHIPVPELCRQPLDIAYITLSASSGSGLGRTLHSRSDPDATFGAESYKGPVDTAIASVMRGVASINSANNTVFQDAASVPKGAHILIIGPAGSGKTTLVQWLALRSAERSFPGELALWNNCLPLVLKLRNLFRGDLDDDVPDEIGLIESAVNRAAAIPGDWVATQLRSRQVLLLLDGLDELPEYHHRSVRIWLERFIERHPSINIIVTSRPEGLDTRWFAKNEFTTLSLDSMEIESIESCVNSWFDAVVSVAPDMEESLAANRRTLIHDVRHRAPVRELAETPLVCAMLCAYYAYEMSESAPESRGDLYEQVIETLVDRRDRGRRAIARDRRGFTSGQKLTLLQAIARYLTERQLLTITTYRKDQRPHVQRQGSEHHETALSIMEREAAGLATLSLSPNEALDYLLKRSVIFRQVPLCQDQVRHQGQQLLVELEG